MNEPPTPASPGPSIDPSLTIGGALKKLAHWNRTVDLLDLARRRPALLALLLLLVWGAMATVCIGGPFLLADLTSGRLHWPGQAQAAPITLAQGIRVIDGDTIQVRVSGERIRIENIDAPEIGDHAHCPAEAVLAVKARYYLEQRIAMASDMTLIPDERRPRDVYGRTLGRVELDGLDVGEDLMKQGLAQPWRGHHAHWC